MLHWPHVQSSALLMTVGLTEDSHLKGKAVSAHKCGGGLQFSRLVMQAHSVSLLYSLLKEEMVVCHAGRQPLPPKPRFHMNWCSPEADRHHARPVPPLCLQSVAPAMAFTTWRGRNQALPVLVKLGASSGSKAKHWQTSAACFVKYSYRSKLQVVGVTTRVLLPQIQVLVQRSDGWNTWAL
jgi:hypothetical protein